MYLSFPPAVTAVPTEFWVQAKEREFRSVQLLVYLAFHHLAKLRQVPFRSVVRDIQPRVQLEDEYIGSTQVALIWPWQKGEVEVPVSPVPETATADELLEVRYGSAQQLRLVALQYRQIPPSEPVFERVRVRAGKAGESHSAVLFRSLPTRL